MRRSAMLGRLYDKLGDGGRHRCRVWTVIEHMLRVEHCKSRTVVDGVESEEYSVGHGAREGAVLSPVLYATSSVDADSTGLSRGSRVAAASLSAQWRFVLYCTLTT